MNQIFNFFSPYIRADKYVIISKFFNNIQCFCEITVMYAPTLLHTSSSFQKENHLHFYDLELFYNSLPPILVPRQLAGKVGKGVINVLIYHWFIHDYR